MTREQLMESISTKYYEQLCKVIHKTSAKDIGKSVDFSRFSNNELKFINKFNNLLTYWMDETVRWNKTLEDIKFGEYVVSERKLQAFLSTAHLANKAEQWVNDLGDMFHNLLHDDKNKEELLKQAKRLFHKAKEAKIITGGQK